MDRWLPLWLYISTILWTSSSFISHVGCGAWSGQAEGPYAIATRQPARERASHAEARREDDEQSREAVVAATVGVLERLDVPLRRPASPGLLCQVHKVVTLRGGDKGYDPRAVAAAVVFARACGASHGNS